MNPIFLESYSSVATRKHASGGSESVSLKQIVHVYFEDVTHDLLQFRIQNNCVPIYSTVL